MQLQYKIKKFVEIVLITTYLSIFAFSGNISMKETCKHCTSIIIMYSVMHLLDRYLETSKGCENKQ